MPDKEKNQPGEPANVSEETEAKGILETSDWLEKDIPILQAAQARLELQLQNDPGRYKESIEERLAKIREEIKDIYSKKNIGELIIDNEHEN